jgi:hypothetical protein
MKALCSAFILVGCAAKKPPKTQLVIPVACINSVQTEEAICRDYGSDLAECDHILIHINCVKVKK